MYKMKFLLLLVSASFLVRHGDCGCISGLSTINSCATTFYTVQMMADMDALIACEFVCDPHYDNMVTCMGALDDDCRAALPSMFDTLATNYGMSCTYNELPLICPNSTHLAGAPIDGGIGEWSEWGTCTTTCESGSISRYRECNYPEPMYGGDNCTGDMIETQNCPGYDTLCPIDGGYGNWTDWSTCDVTCAAGEQTRSRACDSPSAANGGLACAGDSQEVQSCDTGVGCPVDGVYGNWTDWSTCDVTCAAGEQTRSRACDSPSAANGGIPCAGDSQEVQSCDTGVGCPVDGGYGDWTDWSTCDVTCEAGQQTRSRTCDSPSAAHGGLDCAGDSQEVQGCDAGVGCPVNGGWGNWTEWSECSVTCGGGMQSRARVCDNPLQANAGLDCQGETSEMQGCESGILCPIDGGFNDWTTDGTCAMSDTTCDEGTQTWTRACENPMPQNNGAECVGEFTKATTCNQTDNCYVICGDQQLRCDDKLLCVPFSKVCDLTVDCSGGEDETVVACMSVESMGGDNRPVNGTQSAGVKLMVPLTLLALPLVTFF